MLFQNETVLMAFLCAEFVEANNRALWKEGCHFVLLYQNGTYALRAANKTTVTMPFRVPFAIKILFFWMKAYEKVGMILADL